ncbi:MAG: NADH-quinone oxidoreductase subunit J [Candidatus Marinimicrobia bacterium]|nr:NADH-quinone oxidoreductase subunit J [Candidatus Neomarinimicrobiota bacterium]MCF7829011.1 NADH-quinone oxidoreductase subunit J [Candidatus Neomarinimicrobiota bacterium]MCF7879971.1 NADH-quinone oxidoreductase subunit J [Candidatus Neomarinimicrobiota bacterium]
MLGEIIFYIFVGITVLSAGVVVFSPKLIYSVFALLGTFFGVAGLYVFLEADFLAAVQLLIYVGGVLVLLLFGVMLTNRIADINISQGNTNRIVGGVASLGVLLILGYVLLTTVWNPVATQEIDETVGTIGELLMTRWLLPFEVASLLLLAALVGAAMLARRSGEGESV